VTGEATEGELQIDQSALTGESLPVHKKKDSTVYSSSVVKQGQMLAVVTKTGARTFIGRAANLMAITTEQGHFQKIVNQIGNFLVVITVVLVLIIFAVELIKRGGKEVLEVLRMVLVLTVAAIPVGLPTVLSVTMAVGAKQLARKKVIIKRLTAVEEMASVSVLCSDKTGTLTLNELTFDDPYLSPGFSAEDILLYGYLAAEPGANDPIESAVRTAAKQQISFLQNLPKEQEHTVPGFKVTAFVPFNPTTKMTQATVLNTTTNDAFKVAKGAPQVIVRLVGGDDDAVRAVNSLARRGLRALGVARTVPGDIERWQMVGMISLLDPPRPDSAETIRRCAEMGVSVKMITGDQQIIGKEVAHRLGMDRCILNAEKLIDPSVPEEEIVRRCERSDGFAQVIPEHKYRVVELLQEKGYLVGMTGDGVNDAPALKKANVGIAVHGCTDAARSAADIVLLAPGLSTIVDGVTTSRAIFQRMRSYALYRITSTIHFLIFFFFIILFEDWNLPPILLIFIALLNDAATLVISVDNAQISEKPDKWRLGQLITLSFILGVLLTGLSFAHFFIFRDVFHVTPDQLHTVMYLHISSAPHFVIFSTRLAGFFWENLPSMIFFLAVMGTQVFAMFMSWFGVKGLTVAIGPAYSIGIIVVSLLYFVILDIVKVLVMRYWSFELTAKLWPSPARRKKLADRKANEIFMKRYRANVQKVRKVVVMMRVLSALRSPNK
jgi:H+-transporting ATPase